MKEKYVIYGVPGMLEYQALIKVGAAKMKINFTNGSTNEAGRTPATYATSNYAVQHAIENSVEFKNGKIVRVHESLTGSEVYIASEHEEAAEKAVKEPEATKTDGDKTDNAKENVEDTKDTENDEKTEGEKTLVKKEFTCNDDAKDYFEEQHGVKRSTMLNRDAIVAIGKSFGVEVTFTN